MLQLLLRHFVFKSFVQSYQLIKSSETLVRNLKNILKLNGNIYLSREIGEAWTLPMAV